jgi:hypothetical protein
MSKTFVATVPVAAADFPAGTGQGPFRWTLTGPGGESKTDTSAPSASFTVDAGAYTLSVQAFAADGVTPIGPVSGTASFTVSEDTVTLSVVNGDITITF